MGEGDKSREREGGWGGGTQTRLMKKAAWSWTLEDTWVWVGWDTWGAFQVRRRDAGSTSGEEGIVLPPGQSLRGRDREVWMVLQACLGSAALSPRPRVGGSEKGPTIGAL